MRSLVSYSDTRFSCLITYNRLIELKRQLQELKDHQKFSQVFTPTLCELIPRVDSRPMVEGRGSASAVST